MAKVLAGPIFTDARGKVAGTVLSKNAAGLLARKHSSPGAPTTDATQKAKNRLTATARAWAHTLTSTQRQAWINAAAGFTVPDRFGNQIHLTGEAYFIQANANLRTIGVPLMPSPPASRTVTDPAGITVTEISTPPPDIRVTPTNSPQSYEGVVLVAKKPLSAGRTSYSIRSLSTIQAIYPPTPQPWDITQAYNTKYGALPAGWAIILGLYYVNSQNGAKSPTYAYLIVPT